MNNRKKLYINTMGCQMNVVDTERMEKSLGVIGYERTFEPSSADLIIANTCAIREKAEQKAFSFLGRLAALKRKKPGLIVGIGGCVAQQEGEKILKRLPHIDLVFGTDAICRLPNMVQQVESAKERIVDVDIGAEVSEFNSENKIQEEGKISKFVTVMQGCDNFCTYCVVPHVRGREKSREPINIINEINLLAKSGIREVTLLGQNVNSYGKKEGFLSFAELLKQVNNIEGILRIRFTTSHPKDISDDLIEAFNSLEKLCSHIHLPVQSGSNKVLKRMNRKYTREQYLRKIHRLREACPDIAVSSDIIVGFPGETEDDFQDTLDLIKKVEYDSLFVFNYSDRSNAPASAFPNKVDFEKQNGRLQEVLALQEKITAEKDRKLVGQTVSVLVEGMSKKQRSGGIHNDGREIQWSGRTTNNKIVNFIKNDQADFGEEILYGNLAHVKIEKALAHSLWGKMVQLVSKPLGLKGENNYAA